jgi:glycosyltransferase involved in cell wall biosynthesis
MFGIARWWPSSRKRDRPRVLVIDDFVPVRSIGAGVPRASELLRALTAAGAEVILWPVSDFMRAEHPRVTSEGVTIIRHQRRGLRRFLVKQRGAFDGIIVSRPENMRTLNKLVAENPALVASSIIVYDAEAIATERDIIMAEVLGAPLAADEAKRKTDEELATAAGADIVLTVNEHNAARFRAAGHRDARVLRYALRPRSSSQAFQQRKGFLLVGPTRINLEPNSDAVIWFVDHVLPRVWTRLGRHVPVQLAGMTGAPLVVARKNLGLDLLGAVPDLAEVYDRARVFVAPTRFAAGIPLKVYDAAANGIPIVLTPLLASQLGWTHDHEALVAESPQAFADACCTLHEDALLWERLRANAMARVAEDCSVERFDHTLTSLVSDIMLRRQ